MRKFISIICALTIFCIVLSGCNKNTESNNSSQSQTENGNTMNELEQQLKEEQIIKENQILDKIGLDSYLKIITKSYSEQDIFSSGILFKKYNPTISFQFMLNSFEEHFTIECVRKVDDNNVYVVFKTEENGLVYCFFSKRYQYWYLYNSVYLKEKLNKQDFSQLKIGDKIEDVTKIDSAFLSLFNYNKDKNFSTNQSIHLLSDSLLVIEYEKVNQQTIIKNLSFKDDFKFSENSEEYNYKILNQDYPK